MLLTIKNINEACKNNKYILLRHIDLSIVGCNCMVIKKSIENYKDNYQTMFISYIPANINEYISNKIKY